VGGLLSYARARCYGGGGFQGAGAAWGGAAGFAFCGVGCGSWGVLGVVGSLFFGVFSCL